MDIEEAKAAIEQESRRRSLSAIEEEKQRRFSGITEPARAIGSGLTHAVSAGLTGIVEQAIPGGRSGAEAVEDIQAGAYQPESEAGQRNMQRLGDLAQFGIDVVNFPISGLGGLMELIAGQGLDQAANTVRAVQEDGAGVTAGRRVFEETGSPLAATAAHIAPEALAELTALRGSGNALRNGTVQNTAREAVAPVTNFFTRQSPAKQKIAQMIADGSTDRDTAKYLLEGPGNPQALPAPEGVGNAIERGVPRVRRDTNAIEAIRQGFDEGVIAAIKGSSPADRQAMLQMVDIMQQGKRNTRYFMEFRPTDVIGDSLLERYNHVLKVNKDAAGKLEAEASKLRGQGVDASPAVNQFLDDLDSLGVRLDNDLNLDFRGSDIEGVTAAQDILNRVVQRMATSGSVDAYELHRLKRFIDENVSFGKVGEGLSGRTEGILKSLRHNLDGILDESFPSYDSVNTIYKETRDQLDGLQDVAGRKMDLTGGSADKALGTLMRRIMSNAQSRVNLLDSVNQLEQVARRYGGEFETDLLNLTLFADELDSVFGPAARSSLHGEVKKAIPMTKESLITRAMESAVEGLRGVNEGAAFSAIRRVLETE